MRTDPPNPSADPSTRRRKARFPPAAQAALILAALVVVFLGRPILDGGWYLPADFTQVAGTRTLPPTQTLVLQNSLMSDPATQMDPWWHFDSQELHAGRLPSWNPDNALGVPQLANYQAGVFSPYSVPFYLLPYRIALLVAAGLKLWTLAFFAYLFLRRLRLRHGAALLGAVVYGFGAYHLLWLDWQHVGAAICLPAGAWATTIVLQAETSTVRRRGLAAFAVAIAAGVLAGHPETLYWSIATLAITVSGMLVVERLSWRTRLRRAAELIGAAGLGVAVGAVQLLPFAEYLTRSTDYATRSGLGIGGGAPPLAVSLLAFPDAVGNPSLTYQEPSSVYLFGNYNEINGDYVGLIAMGLALLGLTALVGRKRRRVALLGLVITATGWALFHVHQVSEFTTRTPILKLSTVNRSHDVWIFGVAVLAAIGSDVALDRFHHGWAARHARVPVARTAAVAGVAILGIVAVSVGAVALSLEGMHHLRAVQATVPGSVTMTALAVRTVHKHVEWVLGCSGLALLCVVVMLAWPRGAGRRTAAVGGPLLVAGLVVTQFAVTGGMLRNYNPSLPKSLVYPLTAGFQQAIAFTATDTSIRDSTTYALPDSNLWWRMPQLTSYDALGVEWYDTLFRRVFGQKPDEFFDEGTPACAAELRLFGVRWIWSRSAQPFQPGAKAVNSSNVIGPTLANLPLATTFDGVNIFGVPGSTGRFTVVPRVTVAATEKAAVNTVSSCQFNADASAVLLAKGAGRASAARLARVATAPTPPRGGRQRVAVLTDQPEHLRLRVSDGAGGELVLRQTWFPGWQVTVDGHPEPIDRVDEAFRGVELSPGAHTVDMVYRPSSLRDGIIISGLAALLTGLLASGLTPGGVLAFVTDLPTRRRRGRTGKDEAADGSADKLPDMTSGRVGA